MTPEASFLISCARHSAVPGGDGEIASWDRVAALAEGHGMAAWVLRAGGGRLPAPVAARLAGVTREGLARCLLLEVQLARALAALVGSEVPVLVLKGPALARAFYPEPHLRPFGDLDLCVPARFETAAALALTGIGLQEAPREPGQVSPAAAGPAAVSAYHRIFFSADARVRLELHLDCLQTGITPVAESDRWDRAQPVPGLPSALMLAPEDQVLQLSLHALKHGFRRLLMLKDLDLILRREEDRLNWDVLVASCRAEGLEGSTWYALHLCRQLLGTPIPERQLSRLRPSRLLRSLYRVAWPPGRIAELEGRERLRAVQFRTRESIRGMLPSLVFLGRRRTRLAAIGQAIRQGRAPGGGAFSAG